MKTNIWNLLTDHAKWVFSGIGVLVITLILNSTCSNGAEDKKTIVIKESGNNNSGTINYGDMKDSGNNNNNSGTIIGENNSGTINTGDRFNGDKVLVLGDQVSGDKVSGDKVLGDKFSGDKVLGDKYTTYNPPPSFREVTVAQGENGNPVGIADNPSPIQNAVKLLEKVMKGEQVNIQEASPAKFLINSGTEIAILESDNSSEQPSAGFTDPIGFTQFVKIRILEGPYKDRIGWIHAGRIHHEQRKK